MYCPKCGKEIKKGMDFCPYCSWKETASGRQTVQNTTNRSSGKDPQKRINIIIAAIMTFAIMIGCVAITFLLNKNGQDYVENEPETSVEENSYATDYMVDLVGVKTREIIDRYGTDLQFGYYGEEYGDGYFYYPDGITSLRFFISSTEFSGRITGDETVERVEYRRSINDCKVSVFEGIDSQMDYSTLSATLNAQLNEGYVGMCYFVYDRDDKEIIFKYSSYPSGQSTADTITVKCTAQTKQNVPEQDPFEEVFQSFKDKWGDNGSYGIREYAYHDIDEDGQDELIIHDGESERDGNYYYFFEKTDGEVKKIGTYEDNNGKLYDSDGKIIYHEDDQVNEEYCYLSIRNGSLLVEPQNNFTMKSMDYGEIIEFTDV